MRRCMRCKRSASKVQVRSNEGRFTRASTDAGDAQACGFAKSYHNNMPLALVEYAYATTN